MLTIRHVHDGRADPVSRADLAATLATAAGVEGGFVWVDLLGPTPEDETILDDPALDLDPLVREDIREDTHQPKLDLIDAGVFLVVHAIHVESSMLELTTIEIDVVVRERLLVTHRRRASGAVSAVADRIEGGAPGLDRPALVLHRILDIMEDVYAPFLDLLGDRLDIVEEDVLDRPTVRTRAEIFALRRDFITLRRIAFAQAEVVRRLTREPLEGFAAGDRALFRDVYDHLHRMSEVSEVYRQLVESAYDMYRSVREDETNRRLTVLTMVSTLLLPIGVIAGVYGMNFVHMPELDEPWAYPAVLVAFVVILVIGLVVFRAWGWIGSRDDELTEGRRELVERLELPRIGQVLKVPEYGARFAVRGGRRVLGVSRWVTSTALRGRRGRSR